MQASTSTLLLCATLFLDWILFTETVVLFFFFYVSHFLVDFFILGHHWNILQRFMKLRHSTRMFQIGLLLNVLLWKLVRSTHLIFDCVTNPIVLSETFFFVACFPPLIFLGQNCHGFDIPRLWHTYVPAAFTRARAFNSDISKWNTAKVSDMVQSTSTLPFIFSSVGLDLFSHLDFFYLFFSIFCLFWLGTHSYLLLRTSTNSNILSSILRNRSF
jgi:surface protein